MTKDQLRATMGANIHQRRTELGLSQQTLGDAVDLSQAQIARIERGNSSFPADLFAVLGEVLQVDPLFFLTPQRSGKNSRHTLDA